MKRFLLFALAVIVFAACSKDTINEQQNMQTIVDEAPETLTVGFEGDDTRIQLNEALKTVWTKGDLVSVFYLSNANQQWQYQGETGSRVGNLKRIDAGSATEEMKRVVVVYPYNENYYINTDTYNVKAALPATQHYLANSYGLNGNIMISRGEYNNISLKNVCGWLKLQLTGDGEVVKSITFKGNNGEQVAGELYINSAEATAILASDMGNVAEDDGNNATGGAGANLSFDDVMLREVTLDCGEGVALGKNATAFYIALPPQTFEQGFTVEIEDTEGYVMEQSTDKALIIERNHIQPMAAFEFINPATPSAPAPASNEIWYTATAKVEPNASVDFGAAIVRNEWNSTTGKGVITFDGDVTTIGKGAFSSSENLTKIIIPNSVTTIGYYVFENCSNLTNVVCDATTPPTLGDYAFKNVSNITITVPESVLESYRSDNNWGQYCILAPADRSAYEVGNLITIDGVQGVVYFANDAVVRVVSVTETNCKWGLNNSYASASNEHYGAVNLETIKSKQGYIDNYPAFVWCEALGDGWYLPAKNELSLISSVKENINTTLTANNLVEISGDYWSSTDNINDGSGAYILSFDERKWNYEFKNTTNLVRAIKVF